MEIEVLIESLSYAPHQLLSQSVTGLCYTWFGWYPLQKQFVIGNMISWFIEVNRPHPKWGVLNQAITQVQCGMLSRTPPTIMQAL